jgi:hypothetical protein
MSETNFNGLVYEPETGYFFRLKRPNKKIMTVNKYGYIVINVAGKLCFAHRLAWEIVYGFKPNGIIDHINGVKTDNRIKNLRDVNNLINNHNRNLPNKNNKSSGLLGVTKPRHTSKWAASIMVCRRRIHIGYFDAPDEAHAAYLEAKNIYHFSADHLSVF